MKFCHNKIIQFFLIIALTAFTAESLFGQNAPRVRLSEIEQIRNLTLLQQTHMDQLQSYIKGEFEEMFESRDPSDKTRNILSIAQSLSRQENVKQMYSDSFTTAVLDSAKQLQSHSLSIGDKNIFLQSVIVTAGTDNKLAIPALLEHLNSDIPEIRYWAISGFGKPILSKYFISEEGKADYAKVVSALNEMLAKEDSASIIGKIADVAVLTTDEGIKLLKSCVEKRTQQYQSWNNIGNEMIDFQMFLNAVNTVRSGIHRDFKRRETELMHIASEIYWITWQRYRLGSSVIEEGTEREISIFDNSTSQNNLLTILIEGEKLLLTITEDQSEYRMTSNYLMNNSWAVLNRRVEVLIGLTGAVQKVFEIYDSNTEIDLPKFDPPPAELVKNAKNFTNIRNNLLRAEY